MAIGVFPIDAKADYPKILSVSVAPKDNGDYILQINVVEQDGTQRPVGFQGTPDDLRMVSLAIQRDIPGHLVPK